MEFSPLRAPFFYGEYELLVDAKNRLLVPSEVRKTLDPATYGEAFFVTLRSRVPCFYPELYYHHLVNSQIQPDMTPSDDLLAYAQLKFALASRLEWDVQGRVVLPEKLIARASLGKEVVLVGMGDHLQLFNRPDWETRLNRLLEDGPNIETRGKAALQQQPAERQ